MKRFWPVIIFTIVIQSPGLFYQAPAVASESRFYIPSEYGSVKEVFETEGAIQEKAKTIIYLQDAHCNYEAQKNMAGVLEFLIEQYGLKLILVEGGSGDAGLSFLRRYAYQQAREEIADKYLRMGRISGEEYLDIVSDYNFELYGIEDEALYDAHLAAFLKLDSIKEEALRYLAGLSDILNNLSSYIYSDDLKQLDEKSNSYKDKGISLSEYCQFLKEMAYRKGLSIWEYPNLVAFSSTAYLETEIDFQQAELQRNAFIKDMARFLDKEGLKELIDKSQEFKSGDMPQKEYYTFLKGVAEHKIDLEQFYPQFNSYIRYISQSKDIDTKELLREVGVIEGNLGELCMVNSDQKRLKKILKSMEILVEILNVELPPEDYEYFQANKSDFLTASWIDFLTENCRSYNLTPLPAVSSIIDDNLEQLQGFYQLGLAREEAFISNLVNRMDETGENLAVLITGGFHTPGVTRMLRDKGYSYAVVTPVITKKSDPSIYFSVLKGAKSR
ncbi:hypothetical protein ACFL1D_04665 [Candidatus Omnitrophota bacterium]